MEVVGFAEGKESNLPQFYRDELFKYRLGKMLHMRPIEVDDLDYYELETIMIGAGLENYLNVHKSKRTNTHR